MKKTILHVDNFIDNILQYELQLAALPHHWLANRTAKPLITMNEAPTKPNFAKEIYAYIHTDSY